jgi:hypothetical protein
LIRGANESRLGVVWVPGRGSTKTTQFKTRVVRYATAVRNAERKSWLGRGALRAKDLQIPDNMRLLPPPPYSPQLNPVEHLGEEIREKWFLNPILDSLRAVEDRLVEALAALENDSQRVAQVTGFDWIGSIHMNALW